MTTAVHRGGVFGTGAFLFSIACYGVFLVVFLYLLAFLANLQATPLGDAAPVLRELVPLSVDLGRDRGSLPGALAVDIGLLLLFGLQHSVMARPAFKRAWTYVVPKELERSTYVLLSSVVLAVLLWQWRPIPAPVLWHASTTWAAVLGWSIMGLGVAVLLWATFLIDHFELFGLKQGWFSLRGRELPGPAFVTPYLYKLVRHPLYAGWLLIFWGAPTMSAGHLVFSAVMSGYILVALRFEERDLVRHIGEPYRRYRQQVPALLPRPGRRFSG
ncbi:MAG TPA: isoprenylcysteine carboxylmethyltransferase family protein [Steroidobacteraceae bacterium]|nr:isoprenylcysteine carboxylmethyltransferase family protein [Steroidobacteraceae bacterium]